MSILKKSDIYDKEPVAIIGLGSLFPDANSTDKFWENIISKKYSIREVTSDRWDPKLYFAEDKNIPDKTYTKIGGFIDSFEFQSIQFRIPPKVVPQIDLVQQFALVAAKEALEDANYKDASFPNENCAVILGNSMGGDRKTEMDLRVLFPKVIESLKLSSVYQKLSKAEQTKLTSQIEKEYKKDMTEINEDSMPGELANVISGRIAATFNLRGKSMISDAACASSLAAIDEAYKGLITHEFDAVVVGGADRSLLPTTFVKFSKIGALSVSGSYPFDARADGFVQGEGAGMMVLKRLSDAKKAGDKIYALVVGIGASSDGKGKGITAPNPIGQELAIKRAYSNAGIDPSGVQLIEAHGTSTKVGDRVEVNTLNKVFSEYNLPKKSIKLGSIKSQIGHLKSAAGAAGLIKAILAIYHKKLPPSINFETPNPNINWEEGPLVVNTETIDWKVTDEPRRAAVSSFGFGGTNYVVILEEYNPKMNYLMPTKKKTNLSYSQYILRNKNLNNETIKISSNSKDGLINSINNLDLTVETFTENRYKQHLIELMNKIRYNNNDKYRIGITYKIRDELKTIAELSISAISDKNKKQMAQARGIYISEGLPEGKISFLFPGQGSQYADMLFELYNKYTVVKSTFDEADEILNKFLGRSLSSYIFSNGKDIKEINEGLRQTEITQPAMLVADIAIFRLFLAFNIKPDMVAGHSLGEYAALVAANVLSFKDALMAVAIRGKAMSEVDVDDKGTMAAITGSLNDIEKVLKKIKGYCIAANKNSSSSIVISGSTSGVEEAIKAFEKKGMKAIRLSVSAAFHTTIVEPAGIPLAKFLDNITFNKPSIPITSNVTGKFFPEDGEKIREIMKNQIKSSVEWISQIISMNEAGADIFFEVGPKRALSSFASDILKNKNILSVISNHPKKGAIKSFNEVIAAAVALGFDIPSLSSDHEIFREEYQWEHLKQDPPMKHTMKSDEINRNDFSVFMEKTLDYLDKEAGQVNKMGINLDNIVVTGVGVGLPGKHKEIFDENNFDRLLKGENFIDRLPKSQLDAQLDKKIRRLIKKPSGDAEFFTPKSYKDVINLAGQAGKFDLISEFDVNPRIAGTYDDATELAIAAGLLALRDAGIPLVRAYKKTSTGSFLPGGWELPIELQDETGVIFASAFPGYNKFAKEMSLFNKKKYDDKAKKLLNSLFTDISRKVGSETEKKYLLNKLEEELLLIDQEEQEYTFNRKILLEVLSMGHAQFAQLIKARGPNTQVNAACASTTQAIAIANDWIRIGRCKRVIVISADNITSENLFEWLGSGFLATGAAAIKSRVEDAALPFDRRRDGMIVGMGAAALVIEVAEEAKRRGVQPIVEILGTFFSNSSFHGTRLDVNHVSAELGKFMERMKKQHGIIAEDIARSMMFMSHETYTPRRGGSAAAEIHSLRNNFGKNANLIHIANTKGFTGHAMGAGIEDAVAIKAIEKGIIPPIANFKEADPDLGDLRLSKGGKIPVNYALRLAAGFGSQVAFALYKKSSSGDRFTSDYDNWLSEIGGSREDLYLEGKSYRLKDKGALKSKSVISSSTKRVNTFKSTKSRSKPVTSKKLRKSITSSPMKKSSTITKEELSNVLIDQIVKSTGYPKSSVSADLELEADLGVDSVKVAEIFGVIREKYGLEEDGELNLADYPTIDKMAEYFSDKIRGSMIVSSPSVITQKVTTKHTGKSIGKKELTEVLIDQIVESTGYPKSSVSADLELEADLGVDSVKVAEIFGVIREKYGLEEDGELNLADYPTIDKMAEYFSDKIGGSTSEINSSVTTQIETTKHTGKSIGKKELTEVLIDQIVESTGYPKSSVSADLELEADLGVDSVKVAEIFGVIREKYGLEEDGELNLADYPTIDKMAEYFSDKIGGIEIHHSEETLVVSDFEDVDTPISEISSSEEELTKILIEEIANATGYSVDLITPDLELEADLGVDSVKVSEVFGVIRDRYDLEEDGELNIAEYPTIEKMAKYFSSSIRSPEIKTSNKDVQKTVKSMETGIKRSKIITNKSDNLLDRIILIVEEITDYPISMIGEYVQFKEDMDVTDPHIIYETIENDFNLPIGSVKGSNIKELIVSIQKSKTEFKDIKQENKTTLGDKSKRLSLKDKVFTIISEFTDIPISMINEYVSLKDDLGLDETDINNLHKKISTEFGIKLDTVDTIIGIINKIPSDNIEKEIITVKKKINQSNIKRSSDIIPMNLEQVQKKLLEIIADKTGYAESMLELDMSPEEDLGIDSIKVAEIFGDAREEFHIPLNEELDLSEYDTIRKIADYMHSNSGSDKISNKMILEDEQINISGKSTKRYVIRANNGRSVPNTFKGKGYIFARKNAEISTLASNLNLEIKPSLKKDTNIKDNKTTLIFYNPSEKSSGSIYQIFELLKSKVDHISNLVLLIKAKKTSIHAMSPYQGALGGMFKALDQEFDNINTQIVVVENISQFENELSQSDTEVFFRDNTRYVVALSEENIRDLDWKLPEDATIVVTGGAQGITFETIKSITNSGNVIILIGRTEVRDDAEEYANLTEDELEARKWKYMEVLKQTGERITPVILNNKFSKITKSATVWKNIEELKTLGADVIYVPMDVSNQKSVKDGFVSINKILSTVDRSIDYFIHGAGVEISRPTKQKSVKEFQMVYNIKVLGMENILDNLDINKLKRVITFSSVAGRFGNATQTDYSAANEYLSKKCGLLRTKGINATSIDWSAWSDVGMATRGSTMKVLDSLGVTPIPKNEGIKRFISEFALSKEVEVVIAGELGDMASSTNWYHPEYNKGKMIDEIEGKVTHRLLSLKKDRYLNDHRIDGKAVLPGVMGLENMVESVRTRIDEDIVSITDIAFKSPVKLPRDNDLEIITFIENFTDYFDTQLKSKFVGPDGKQLGELREHFSARIIPGKRLDGFPISITDGKPLIDSDDIYKIFFHGPSYQVLDTLTNISNSSAFVTFKLPEKSMFDEEIELEINPLSIEAAFQAAGLHLLLTRKTMGLPSRVGAIHLFRDNTNIKYLKVYYLGSTETHSLYDVQILDEDGICVTHITEYEMIHTGNVEVPSIDIEEDDSITQVRNLAGSLNSSIFSVDVKTLENINENFIDNFFSKSERSRYNGLKVSKKRTEWLAGRIAAKYSLSKYLNIPVQLIEIRKDENKAPYTEYADNIINVSISHSHGIAIGIAGNLAVDVEKVSKRGQAFVKQMFSDKEQKELSLNKADDITITKYWSMKEAHLKRMRIGLKTAIKKVELRKIDDNTCIVNSDQGSSISKSFYNNNWIVSISTEK